MGVVLDFGFWCGGGWDGCWGDVVHDVGVLMRVMVVGWLVVLYMSHKNVKYQLF